MWANNLSEKNLSKKRKMSTYTESVWMKANRIIPFSKYHPLSPNRLKQVSWNTCTKMAAFWISWKACNFIKKTLKHRCLPVKYAKFLRAPTLKNIYFWLLLNIRKVYKTFENSQTFAFCADLIIAILRRKYFLTEIM